MDGRRTDADCYLCEDGTYIQLDHERFCDTCFHSPSKQTRMTTTDVWGDFWAYRADYVATNDERPKAPGGFAAVYLHSDGLY